MKKYKQIYSTGEDFVENHRNFDKFIIRIVKK